MQLTLDSPTFSIETIDELAAQVNRDGICVIPGLFPLSMIDSWLASAEELRARRAKIEGGLAGREKARYYMTLPWCEPFADTGVFAHCVITQVISAIFKQQFSMVQLGADFPLRGSDYQEIHRDHSPLFGEGTVSPLYALAVNFPLVDVGEENGPFQMARGTHLLDKQDGLRKIASGEIPIESFHMERGDVIIRTPLALHRGTPNNTDQWRPMIVMGYVMNWLSTDNVAMNIPSSYYNSLPAHLQKMLRATITDEESSDKQETYLNFKY